MKKLYVFLCIMLFGQICFGQGKDIVLYLDGSSSISLVDFNNLRPSIDAIIESVLECNENNRLAVVHFATVGDDPANANIFIESDFTFDPAVALNYSRRTIASPFGTFDHPHASLLVLGDALDSQPNTHIFGLVSELTRNPNNELVILMITDACRQNISSPATFGLLNPFSYAIGLNPTFENYTTFKNERLARFVVVLSPDPVRGSVVDATAAAASVASAAGGSYNSVIESYPADPQVGEGNRYLTVNSPNNFVFSHAQIEQITSDVCEECLQDLVLISPDNDVTATSFQRRRESITASNQINNDTVGQAVYHAGNFVELLPGFETFLASRFAAYIEDCDNGFAYKNRIKMKNNLRSFSNVAQQLNIFPNPSNTSVNVSYNEAIKNIRILSMDGKTIFTQNANEKEFQIDVSTFVNGIYLITVETQNGQFLQSKFIKN